MSLTKMFLVAIVSLYFVGCSNGKAAGSSNASSEDPNGSYADSGALGYVPGDRWPEGGGFAYNLSATNGDVTCTTTHRFDAKASYCMALQDAKVNENCALGLRQSTYQDQCGTDFQQVNFETSFYIDGFDARLNKQCSTGAPGIKAFQYTSQFCEFLKNETLHAGCMWDARQAKFNNLGCAGDFSPAP
jgi:hypothetical protein